MAETTESDHPATLGRDACGGASPAPFGDLPVTGWYPRHMLKAGADMSERLKLVDLVVEILDARLPELSRNPMFERLFEGKPRFLLFNKADLAPEDSVAAWRVHFERRRTPCAFVDSLRGGTSLGRLPSRWADRVQLERRERGATRPLLRPVRVLIAGIPNVGKSTLVNRLVATRRSQVGPRPGITRSQVWIRLKNGIELLDTPGVMWPRVHDKIHELKLGLIGAIKEDLLGEELLAEYLHTILLRERDRVRWDVYQLETPPETAEQLLEDVGRRRGILKPGGSVDRRQSAIVLLADFRQGRLGRIPLSLLPNDSTERPA